MNRMCLFGGALACAGLAGVASAQFTFSNSYVVAEAYSYAPPSGPSYDTFLGGGPWSVLASEPGGSGSGSATATSLGVYATSGTTARGRCYLYFSYFTVASNVVATAAWDDAGTVAGMTLFNLTDSVGVLNVAGVGTQPVPLLAGKSYVIQMAARQDAGQIGTSYATLTIPSPGGAGLLGFVGVVAMRRRR
ncbi:MAG: hypothetical protein H6811_08090 [Phycisphaeraceae bacterium]|nr:hypothetical protein [Phycisphaeraceae bacterium]